MSAEQATVGASGTSPPQIVTPQSPVRRGPGPQKKSVILRAWEFLQPLTRLWGLITAVVMSGAGSELLVLGYDVAPALLAGAAAVLILETMWVAALFVDLLCRRGEYSLSLRCWDFFRWSCGRARAPFYACVATALLFANLTLMATVAGEWHRKSQIAQSPPDYIVYSISLRCWDFFRWSCGRARAPFYACVATALLFANLTLMATVAVLGFLPLVVRKSQSAFLRVCGHRLAVRQFDPYGDSSRFVNALDILPLAPMLGFLPLVVWKSQSAFLRVCGDCLAVCQFDSYGYCRRCWDFFRWSCGRARAPFYACVATALLFANLTLMATVAGGMLLVLAALRATVPFSPFATHGPHSPRAGSSLLSQYDSPLPDVFYNAAHTGEDRSEEMTVLDIKTQSPDRSRPNSPKPPLLEI
ncbi:transmembrane protein family 72 domain-containing protein [Phthorimaea operculella]|nr:transmembrane protein family 72 domain-containing protein [Phthorimaea operculella]